MSAIFPLGGKKSFFVFLTKPKRMNILCFTDCLVSLVVKASISRPKDPGFKSCLHWDFSGSSHTSDLKIGTPVAACHVPGIIGSVLGLVGPVSVYCDWMR